MALNDINLLIEEKKWYPARKLILQELKQHSCNIKLWEMLFETYYEQKYFGEALEISSYLYLIQPSNKKYKANYDLLVNQKEKFKESKLNFPELLNLSSTTVAVCLIFKNNIETLPEWYERVKGKFNQIIVVDTGSTDGSANIFKDKEDVIYINYEWDHNFSNARNTVYSHLNSEWVVWIDSDEWLEEIYPQLNGVQFVANYYHTLKGNYIITVDNANKVNGIWMSVLGIPRMHNTGAFNFQGAIHETITPIKSNLKFQIVDSGIKLLHFGYDNDFINQDEKLHRNIAMLEEAIKNGKNDPTTLYYLGREYKFTGNFALSKKYLILSEEKAKKQNSNKLLINIYRHLSLLYVENKLYKECVEVCKKGLTIEPDFIDFTYIKNVAELELIIIRLNELYEETRKIKEVYLEKTFMLPPDESIVEWRSDKLQADILRFSGYLAESKTILNEINRKYPSLSFGKDFEFIDNQKNRLVDNK